jgi:hypothetical protein
VSVSCMVCKGLRNRSLLILVLQRMVEHVDRQLRTVLEAIRVLFISVAFRICVL